MMHSSFYIHIALVFSSIIFSFSFFSLIKRLPAYRDVSLSSKIRIRINSNSHNSSIIFKTKIRKKETNDEYLQEKILGSNKTSQSILHRFKFINPSKLICNYPNDTQNFMIILILSRGLNFDYRQVIRATWGRNGKYKKTHIHIKTVFFVGTDDSVQLALRTEQTMFNDVVEVGKKKNL